MAAPQRIFKYATTAQLNALLQAAITRATSGEFTSLSGAQKSSSKAWLDLQQQLVELNNELDIRGNVKRPQQVVQDLTGIYGPYNGNGFSIP